MRKIFAFERAIVTIFAVASMVPNLVFPPDNSSPPLPPVQLPLRVRAVASNPTASNRPEAHLLEPFWASKTMWGEALLFVKSPNRARPSARLVFTPTKGVSLRNASGQAQFVEGKDYTVDAKSRTITLTEGSKIPFVTEEALNPAPGSPNSMAGNRDGKSHLLWSEGHFFHDLEMEATYAHRSNEWKGYKPEFGGEFLTKTIDLLKRKQPLQMVVLGDSISAGYNASGFIGVEPMMSPYAELVRANLHEFYGADVKLKNLAVAGKTAEWGLAQTDAVIAAKPDLVILAFGMNGSTSFDPLAYIGNIKKIIGAVQARLPDTEFILVASMLPNPNWTSTQSERFPLYRDELLKLIGPGVTVADLTSVWDEMIARKSYLDLTGNGLNHPNDFGHRLYAQVILKLLVQR